MKSSVLITGASGFIGGYVAAHFSNAGWQVIGIDRNVEGWKIHPAHPQYSAFIVDNLLSVDNVISALTRFKPAICIHLAGPANVKASFQQPVEDFKGQTLPLMSLLEAARLSNSKMCILLISSAAVYGNPVSLPVREDDRLHPVSPYGFHKCAQELILDEYAFLYGVATCKARIFSTYGPGMSQLAVWDITRRAMRGDFTIFGSGDETRDYLYVEDVASALHSICEKSSFANDVINVASGSEISIKDLAGKIYQVLGVHREAAPTGQIPAGMPSRWRADITRLKQLGFVHKVSLDEGINATVKWVSANV